MKGLVEVIARALVDDPTPVEVHEVDPAGQGGESVYRLKVGKDDLGKVIGKKGRTAKAFRTLLAAAAAKQNRKMTLEILEPERLRRAPDPTRSDGSNDGAANDGAANDGAANDGGANDGAANDGAANDDVQNDSAANDGESGGSSSSEPS